MSDSCLLPMPWGNCAYFDAEGEGYPTVFLHGTGCDTSDWQDTFGCLNDGVRVIAMDFRGHGLSEVPAGRFTIEDLADDVQALMAHLNLRRPLLVGHSLGGMVAMAVARKTQNVGGLILLEGWTALSCVREAFHGERMFGNLSPEKIEHIRAKSSETKARFSDIEWQFFWESVKAFDAEDFLKQTDISIWQVYGNMGRKADSEHRLRVPCREPIFWHWVNGAGHYLPHECCEEIAGICHQAIGYVAHENG
jgi:pimeloyl-ACP methyl ester carboxylesterase